MCNVCGCGEDDAHHQGKDRGGDHHTHHVSHDTSHHERDHAPPPTVAQLHFGQGAAGVSVPGMSQARLIELDENLMAENDGFAAKNRAFFETHGVLALNLMSSPGAGKTTLLVKTIECLMEHRPIAVIEGDQQTSHDAERIAATGAAALQVNTGNGCHLDAHMIDHALARLSFEDDQVLFIENVGNLVCPAGFDLGEAAKVVIVSVPEGADKPLKYPNMFAAADLMIISKWDLIQHVSFDADLCIEYAHSVNASLDVIRLSATTGEGIDQWIDWIGRMGRTRRQRDGIVEGQG